MRFGVGRPVVTEGSTVDVDGLALGEHVFTLVVVDDAGQQSKPAQVKVSVIGGEPPGPRPPRPKPTDPEPPGPRAPVDEV